MSVSDTIKVQTFEELTSHHIYEILKLRQDVFIIEQESIYEDIDRKDFSSLHLLQWSHGILVAYARILPPNTEQAHVQLGRIIIHPDFRSKGKGRELIQKGLSVCKERFPLTSILIGAQQHLESYYSSFGFECVSEPYDDGGIPHIKMLKSHSLT